MEERTQAELAFRELSHRISSREIAPDERIKEQFWASQLNVNRAAIRESLTRLLGEGVVRQGERGGFFVSEMTKEDIHDIREIREILEIAAFSLACDRATPEQIREIAETCDDFGNFVKKGYFTGAREADLRFHQLLITASRNNRLCQLYNRSHIPLFQSRDAAQDNDLDDFIQTEQEHRRIVEALRKKDKRLGAQYLRQHFSRGMKDEEESLLGQEQVSQSGRSRSRNGLLAPAR